MQDADILNSDVKALLILLLLKTGTSAGEIATALQMAATSRLVASPEHPAREIAPESLAEVDRHLAETPKLRAVAPKPPLRSVQAPQIKGYAA